MSARTIVLHDTELAVVREALRAYAAETDHYLRTTGYRDDPCCEHEAARRALQQQVRDGLVARATAIDRARQAVGE